VISLGSSGIGKTHLQEKVSALVPDEDKVESTSLTSLAIYYFGRYDLRHKLLLFEDLDGASDAFYVIRELQSKRDRAEMLEDFIAAYDFLKSNKECNGKIGVVGFCFGGWIANMMAVRIPELAAAVPFYGGQPTAADVPKIKAPLLLHYGELDTRVNEGWPAYEAALKENKKDYAAFIYPKANHGFHNDTTPRYDKEAAELAWKRTLDLFTQKLR
jgi:dienelactone hydrolase